MTTTHQQTEVSVPAAAEQPMSPLDIARTTYSRAVAAIRSNRAAISSHQQDAARAQEERANILEAAQLRAEERDTLEQRVADLDSQIADSVAGVNLARGLPTEDDATAHLHALEAERVPLAERLAEVRASAREEERATEKTLTRLDAVLRSSAEHVRDLQEQNTRLTKHRDATAAEWGVYLLQEKHETLLEMEARVREAEAALSAQRRALAAERTAALTALKSWPDNANRLAMMHPGESGRDRLRGFLSSAQAFAETLALDDGQVLSGAVAMPDVRQALAQLTSLPPRAYLDANEVYSNREARWTALNFVLDTLKASVSLRTEAVRKWNVRDELRKLGITE